MILSDGQGLSLSRGLTRRELIALGSAAAFGAAWPEAAWASKVLGLEAPLDVPMSVGYLAGSDRLERLDVLPWNVAQDQYAPDLEVEPALAMSLGDQNLANESVWMIVHGFYPKLPPKRIASFETAGLVVFFPSEDPLAPGLLPVVACSSRRLPARSTAARNCFVMPLRLDGGLRLAAELSYLVGKKTERVRLHTDFTVDWQRGRPKLQRGIYFLGLGQGTWDGAVTLPRQGEQPRWDLCSLVVSFERMPSA